tara:strand:- start:172 stop:633 length:462 start_codon:yes stop_codon:yes gene_type:complete
MRNRFNINEEEKNHIRGLHNINEQIGSKYMGGYSELGLPIAYENCVSAEDITDEQIEEFYSYVDGLILKYKFETELQVPECRRNSTINEDTGMGTTESQHETFMSNLDAMCGSIVDMGDKMIGRRKCDGNKSDGSGGCYEPLIKLVKQYCKTK